MEYLEKGNVSQRKFFLLGLKFMGHITVLVVEDDSLARLGLKLSLEDTNEFEVIAEASDGQEAVEQALNRQPNVILMDVGLPLMNGVEACRRIKSSLPEATILMLSSHIDKETIDKSFDAGADGYCYKEIGHARLTQIMKEVACGKLTARIWT
jgi:DNA-binding NarL/FixJ family response regulator